MNTLQANDRFSNRWLQLILGLICMMAISSPQYVWALFTKHFMTQFGSSLAELQITFSLLIVLQTFFSPFQGYLVEKFGARILISTGSVLTGLSWIFSSYAASVHQLYFTYGVLGGLGTGVIYVGVVGLMVRWFQASRGLAAGIVAAGYGFGAVLTTFPISSSINDNGLMLTLQIFGALIGGIGLLAAQGIRVAPQVSVSELPASPSYATQGVGPSEMLKTPIFWLMFLMMSMMSTSGLMVISQMGAFSKDFGVSSALVWGMAALPLALTIDRVTNGLTRPFFGWISDQIGRENTMTIAFGFEALAMLIWVNYQQDPVMFVVLSGLVFFGWGEIFSLFPATLTDIFGAEHATANYGCLYMAQGVGSIIGGPIAAWVHQSTQSWSPVFYVMIGLDAGAAVLAYFVLKPMRLRRIDMH